MNSSKIEYLFESFTSPVNVIYQSDEVLPHGFAKHGVFKIDEKEFKIIIEKNQQDRLMLVNFYRIEGANFREDDIGDLEKSQVLSVFSTIIQEVLKYSKDSNAIILQSSTRKKHDVYWNITKKFKDFERAFTLDGTTIILNRKSQETLQIEKIQAEIKKMKYFKKDSK